MRSRCRLPLPLARTLETFAILATLAISAESSNAALTADWQASAGPFGGPIVALAAAPAGSALYAATSQTIYRTTNAGVSWTPISHGSGVANVNALTVGANGTVLVGVSTRGAYWTTNNGATWDNDQITHDPHGGLGASIMATAVDGAGRFFASSFRSTNAGNTWQSMSLYAYAFALGSGNTLFAGNSAGVHRSTNSGVSWTAANAGIETQYVMSLALDPSGNLYCGTWMGGVFKSTNSGVSWTSASVGLPAAAVRALATDSAGRLFAGTEIGVYRSLDAGGTWTALASAPAEKTTGVAAHQSMVFAAIGGRGVLASSDLGATWDSRVNGLAAPTLGNVAFAPNGALAISSYGGGVFVSNDGGSSWTQRLDGLDPYVSATVALANGDLLAATISGVYASVNDGLTWQIRGPELDGMFVHQLVLDGSGALFAEPTEGGGFDESIHRSTDNGASWQPVLAPSDFEFPPIFREIATGGASDVYIAAQLISGERVVAHSPDSGDSWTVSAFAFGSALDELAVSPEGDVYAAGGEFDYYRSTNQGATWNPIANGALFPADLVAASQGHLFSGNTGGEVMASDDFGATWQPFETGLPLFGGNPPAVASLTMAPDGTALYLGSWSAGLYKRSLLEPAGVDIAANNGFPGRLSAAPNPFVQEVGLRLIGVNSTLFAPATRINIVDITGRVLRSLPLTTDEARWDGLDANGRSAPAGVYFASLSNAPAPNSSGRLTLIKTKAE